MLAQFHLRRSFTLALLSLALLGLEVDGQVLANVRVTFDASESRVDLTGANCVRWVDAARWIAVWRDLRDGNEEIYYCLVDSGVPGPELRLTTDAAKSVEPTVAADGSSSVWWIFWRDERDLDKEIYYNRIAGGVPDGDVRLTSSVGDSGQPACALDGLGDPHVVWQDKRAGNEQIYYVRFNGGVAGAPVQLTSDPSKSKEPSIAIDSSGVAHVVWKDERDGNEEIYTMRVAGGIPGVEVRVTSDPAKSKRPDVDVDPVTGDTLIAWEDERTGVKEIFYARVAGISVVGAALDLSGDPAKSERPSIGVDSSGTVSVLWTDERDGNKEIYLGGLSQQDRVLQPLRITANVAKSERGNLAVTASGDIALIWQDERDGNKEIYTFGLGCPGGLCGDCDGDGRVTIVDTLLAARSAIGLATLDLPALQRCDVRSFTAPLRPEVSVIDALIIARSIVGLEILTCCP